MLIHNMESDWITSNAYKIYQAIEFEAKEYYVILLGKLHMKKVHAHVMHISGYRCGETFFGAVSNAR